MRQLFRQIGQRGSEIVDEIGKLFHQVVGKRGPRLQGGKLLPFFLAQGFSDERTRPGFPFCHSFGSGDGVERLHGLLENLCPIPSTASEACHRAAPDWLVMNRLLLFLVYLVCLVCLVYLVGIVDSTRQTR